MPLPNVLILIEIFWSFAFLFRPRDTIHRAMLSSAPVFVMLEAMADPVSYAQENIDQRRKRLIEIDRERVTVAAELRVFEDMLMKFSEGVSPVQERPSKAPASSAGAFQMSGEWITVLRMLDARGKSFVAADVVRVARGAGITLSVPAVRSQFSHYLKRGYLRKVGRGKYSITAKGREKFVDPNGAETNQGRLALKENEAHRVSPSASDAGESLFSPDGSQKPPRVTG